MQSTAMMTASQPLPKKLPPLSRNSELDASQIKKHLEVINLSPIDERLTALGPFRKKGN